MASTVYFHFSPIITESAFLERWRLIRTRKSYDIYSQFFVVVEIRIKIGSYFQNGPKREAEQTTDIVANYGIDFSYPFYVGY